MRNIIKRIILTAVCVFTIASQTMPVMAADTVPTSATATTTVTTAPVDPTLTSEAATILNNCNNERLKAGLCPYVWSSELARAATIRVAEASKKMSHVRPDGTAFYTASTAAYGENIARNYNASTVVTGWMNSPTHKMNVLDSGFKSIGIATYKANGCWYCVAEFGY